MMTRIRRTMKFQAAPNVTDFFYYDYDSENPSVKFSRPVDDLPPEIRTPFQIDSEKPHNWNSNITEESSSLNFPLLVVLASILIPTLIATIFLFAFLKLRRRKQRGVDEIDIQNDTLSGQLNGSFKKVDPDSKAVFITKDELKLDLTSKPHVESTTGRVPVTSAGGLFQFTQNNILISVPSNVATSTSEIHFGINQEKNLPNSVETQNILSDVLTLLPHNATFSRHILIKIPINMSKVKDIGAVQLMYSCTDESENPVWINLPPYNQGIRHLDPIFWMVIGGDCYLFTTHFCHVFVTQFCSVLEQSALFLQASLHSHYDADVDEVSLTVGFHCGKCYPNMLKEKTEYGSLVGKCYKCVYGREGNIKVLSTLSDPVWNSPNAEMVIDTDDLLNLCNLDDIFPPLTFVYTPDGGHCSLSAGVVAEVQIVQGDRKPLTIRGTLKPPAETPASKLQPLRIRAGSDPVEHVDPSCSPREHTEDIPGLPPSSQPLQGHTDTDQTVAYQKEGSVISSPKSGGHRLANYFVVPLQSDKLDKENVSLPSVFTPQLSNKTPLICESKRNGGSIFECHVKYEEKELCRLLDQKTDLLVGLVEEMGILKDFCPSSGHLNGERILQIWKILVITHQKTWIDLHSSLVKMNMGEAAQQLKMAYEKDLMI